MIGLIQAIGWWEVSASEGVNDAMEYVLYPEESHTIAASGRPTAGSTG